MGKEPNNEETPLPPLGPASVMGLCAALAAINAAALLLTGWYLAGLFTLSGVGFVLSAVGLCDRRFFYAGFPKTVAALKIPLWIQLVATGVAIGIAVPLLYFEFGVLR